MMVDRYLARLGLSDAPAPTLAGLTELQQRHLEHVPFENLDVFMQRPVSIDPVVSTGKIVDGNRGGWCFELNGAFAELLRSLGFEVRVLGAATLFGGPSDLVDHMVLEVVLDEPYLVDVGFGRHSPIAPIPFNVTTHQAEGATYEFIASPKGTTLTVHEAGTPVPLCRFKRVVHDYDEFTGASERLQNDRASIFRQRPFATRLLATDGSRITLSTNALTTQSATGDEEASRPVAAHEWPTVLAERFGISGVEVDLSLVSDELE